MYRFKKSLIALMGVLTLVVIVTVSMPHIGRGASGASAPTSQTQNVKVVNTPGEAVPIQGAVTPGTGTLWNVAIAGTPNVAIDGSANTVKVDTSSPLAVRDLDNPARQPFQDYGNVTINDGQAGGDYTLAAIPAGKRLVIEFVSVRSCVQPGQVLQTANIDVWTHSLQVSYDLEIKPRGSLNGGCDLFVGSQQVRLYADAGSNVTLEARRIGTAGQANALIMISGYFVDTL